MVGSDMVIAWVDSNSTAWVSDRWSTDTVMPSTDVSLGCTSDVSVVQGFRQSMGNLPTTAVTFTRALVTNDSSCDVPITNSFQRMLW